MPIFFPTDNPKQISLICDPPTQNYIHEDPCFYDCKLAASSGKVPKQMILLLKWRSRRVLCSRSASSIWNKWNKPISICILFLSIYFNCNIFCLHQIAKWCRLLNICHVLQSQNFSLAVAIYLSDFLSITRQGQVCFSIINMSQNNSGSYVVWGVGRRWWGLVTFFASLNLGEF